MDSRFKRIAKLVLGNILVLLVMIWSLNLLASLWIDGRNLHKRMFPAGSKRAESPSLEDREHARLIYREKDQTRNRYAPFVAWSRVAFQGRTTTVNAEGDRVHPGTPDQPKGHVRIFGGSTVWGSGVDDANTIPAHLNLRHPDYRVHNHGETGFNSRQELARLINLANQDAPMDVVVFYDGCNESNACRSDYSINGHLTESALRAKLEPKSFVADDLFGSLGAATKMILGDLGIREKPGSLCQQDPQYTRRLASTLLNNWKFAKEIAELRGAEFHAILQPVAVAGRPNLEHMTEPPKRKKKSNRGSFYLTMQQLIAEEQADWIHDFTDVFDMEDYIYIDTCHVNALGNELVAERIDRLIADRLARSSQ